MVKECFQWAQEYPELQQFLQTFGYYELDKPVRYKFKITRSILQKGPQCGLTALAMCVPESDQNLVANIFKVAKESGFSKQGEIFSLEYMSKLGKQFLKNKVEVFSGSLDCPEVVEFLFDGGLMLVPYDVDKNNQPCLKNGEKAHWALVFGAVDMGDCIYVLARQGVSAKPAVWSLKVLAESNSQLWEFSRERAQSNIDYVIPEGGIAGKEGLNNRSLLIYPNYS